MTMETRKNLALRIVDEFAEKGNRSTSWTWFSLEDFVKQLKDRIQDPYIHQTRGTYLCGPASFVYNVLHHFPDMYARFAIDLYKHAKARINVQGESGGLEVDVSGWRKSRLTKRSAAEIGFEGDAIDWMILASLRNSENLLFLSLKPSYGEKFDRKGKGTKEDIVNFFHTGTMPNEVATWYRKAGFREVFFETSTMRNKGEASLQEANHYINNGYIVSLFINSQILHSSAKDARVLDPKSPPAARNPTHWIVLMEPIQWADGDEILVSYYDYGEPKPLTRFNRSVFLANYFGYIAACA